MTSFFVSVEPTGELWEEGEGEGEGESEDGVAVAVSGVTIADSSIDDEGCVSGRSVLDRGKVDTRLNREDSSDSFNEPTIQLGFKLFTKDVSAP